MAIQVVSDLHLEAPTAYDVFEIPASTHHLALLGDIGNVRDAGLMLFLEKVLQRFRVVFLLLGNHEPYHGSWPQAKAQLQQLKTNIDKKRGQIGTARTEDSIGDLVILDQTRYDISDEITVLGCTLFSHVTEAQKDYVSFGLNDFFYVEGWSVDDHNRTHAADVEWLNEQVAKIEREEPSRRVIIMTHHCPTLDSRAFDPKHSQSNISSGFATDLRNSPCMTSSCVKIWTYGHTHFNCDFVCEATNTRIIANQRGYYFAQAGGIEFQLEKKLEVKT